MAAMRPGKLTSVMPRMTAVLTALLVIGGLAGAPASANPVAPPGILTFGGLQRTYLLHVPAGLPQPAGLVINLHGAGMNGPQQAGLTGYNAVADRFGFVVAYPDGIDASWADGRGASIPDRQGVDDVGFLATLIERVRAECPRLLIGVRLSLFDVVPWHMVDGHGEPFPFKGSLPYDCGFGVDEMNPLAYDLAEPIALLRKLRDLGVCAVNLTAGSPYTVPHMQRPAAFPPSDGYPPPEDPLIGVWRQIDACRKAKEAVPELVMVGSGYTYLQDYVVHAAQATVARGWIDSVGLGRMVLSYPALPADALAGTPLVRSSLCRTFSDCTTAPRHGLRSGCYPLDAYYKSLPEAAEVKAIKARMES